MSGGVETLQLKDYDIEHARHTVHELPEVPGSAKPGQSQQAASDDQAVPLRPDNAGLRLLPRVPLYRKHSIACAC
jgi:hypothetical protein